MEYVTLPSQSELLSLFDYRDGVLYWKNARGKKTKAGDKAGSFCNTLKYCRITIDKRIYRLHRVIWKMLKGYDPIDLDHINRVKHDNRIENLREVTQSQNLCNRGLFKNNTSGITGVSFHSKSNKWRVRIHYKKICTQLGVYDDYELACLVAEEARDKYYRLLA